MFTDLEFKYQNNIWFLVLAVAATIFFIMSFRKKEKIMAMLKLNYKIGFKAIRSILLFIALALIVLSLLGPQTFKGYTELQKTGMDIYVLIDTSKSMLVTDIMPDRISIAKKIIGDLLNNLEGDRIGFIPFASDAYIQMPLTDDYQLAGMFLDVIDTDMISGGGTNLSAAISLANSSFERASGADKVIIILSDGEEHDDESQNALKSIIDDSVRIYTIGIGTEKGGLVPVYSSDGGSIVDYMKDENNNPVTSRLNAETLKLLAQQCNGLYYQANTQGIDIAPLINELSGLEKDVHAVDNIKTFKQLYQYFLAIGIALFLIVWMIPENLSAQRLKFLFRRH